MQEKAQEAPETENVAVWTIRRSLAESSQVSAWKDHQAIILSLLVVVLTFLKVSTISRWNPSTTSALLDAMSPTELVFMLVGTVMSPLLLFSMPAASTYLRRSGPQGERSLFVTIGAMLVWVVALLVVPIYLLVIIALLDAVPWLYRKARRRDTSQRKPLYVIKDLETQHALIAGMVCFIALGFVFSPSVGLWMPEERIAVDGESTTGFVVDEAADWTSILTSEDREVVRVPSGDVESREVCRTSENRWLSPMVGLGSRGGYVDCED